MAEAQKKPAENKQKPADTQKKPTEKKPTETQNKSTKTLALITYGISLLCLVLGLLLPFGPQKADGYNAVIMQIPHALECFGVKWDAGAALTYSFPISFWGGAQFELGGLFLLLYVLVTVAALGVLVAVILGNKEKDTSFNCACVIEVISTVVISVLLFMEMTMFSAVGYTGYEWSISLVIAFGGPLLMLIIKSIYHKGSSGVIKTVLAILSIISIVFCLFSFAGILPALAEGLKNLLNGNTQLIKWEADGLPLGSAWFHVYVPFTQDYGKFLGGLGGMNAAVSVFMLILGLLMIVNFFLDVCGLAKKTKRWMLLSNLIRYGVELLLVLLVLILGGVVGKHTVGMTCYILLTLSLVLTAINIIRFVTYKDEEAEEKQEEKKEEKKPAPAPAQKAAAAPAPRPQPAPQPAPVVAEEQPYNEAPVEAQPYSEIYEQPEPQPQPAPAPQPAPVPQAQPAPVVAQNGTIYSPVIYNGPRDEFIDTLSNEQRIEFAKTFIERRSGNLHGVPEYVVDGDNDRFFQSLFIYYAHVRGLVSDGLMNKFYEQVSAIKR